jgi:hypothetical protein
MKASRILIWVTTLASAICITFPGYIYAVQEPDAFPPPFQKMYEKVHEEVQRLEALVRRLHGNKAALFPVYFESTTQLDVNGVHLELYFCTAGGKVVSITPITY